jgi:HAD superfamily hydrolase (TIGR01509 family)
MLDLVGTCISVEDHQNLFNGLHTLKKIEMLTQQDRLPVGIQDQFVQLKAKYFKEFLRDELEPDPYKIALIQHLKREFLNVAVVSNCNRQNAELLLRGIGLFDEIEYLVSSSDVVAGKPSPEGYYKAMLTFGVSRDETLIVEDSPVGVAAAKASGAHVLVVKDPTEVCWLNLQRFLS